MSIHDTDNELLFEAYGDPDSIIDPSTERDDSNNNYGLDKDDVDTFDNEARNIEYILDDIAISDPVTIVYPWNSSFGVVNGKVTNIDGDAIIINTPDGDGRFSIDEINDSSDDTSVYSSFWHKRRKARFVNQMKQKYQK